MEVWKCGNAFHQENRGYNQLNIFILICFIVQVYEMSYGELFRITEAMAPNTRERKVVKGKNLEKLKFQINIRLCMIHFYIRFVCYWYNFVIFSP